MDPLGQVTYETFRDRVGESFRDAESGVAFELLEVADLTTTAKHVPPDARAPFALTFRAPLEPVLAQGIKPLEHDDLGRLEIFVVPVAREADGMRYEAVFN